MWNALHTNICFSYFFFFFANESGVISLYKKKVVFRTRANCFLIFKISSIHKTRFLPYRMEIDKNARFTSAWKCIFNTTTTTTTTIDYCRTRRRLLVFFIYAPKTKFLLYEMKWKKKTKNAINLKNDSRLKYEYTYIFIEIKYATNFLSV